MKRSENSEQLNFEIYLFCQKLCKGYNYFIITNVFITFFSLYYISCFNNVYQYTRNEWIISSIFFIIVTLVFNALSALLETIFRYLSFKCENDQIYKFSLYFRMLEWIFIYSFENDITIILFLIFNFILIIEINSFNIL